MGKEEPELNVANKGDQRRANGESGEYGRRAW